MKKTLDHILYGCCSNLWLIIAGMLLVFSCKNELYFRSTRSLTSLVIGFINPLDTIQTSVYWYWMSDNISKEGVVKDLQAMKRVSINWRFC